MYIGFLKKIGVYIGHSIEEPIHESQTMRPTCLPDLQFEQALFSFRPGSVRL